MEQYYTGSQPTSWGLDAMFLSRFDYEADLNLISSSLFDVLREDGYRGYYLPRPPGSFRHGNGYARLFRVEISKFLMSYRASRARTASGALRR